MRSSASDTADLPDVFDFDSVISSQRISQPPAGNKFHGMQGKGKWITVADDHEFPSLLAGEGGPPHSGGGRGRPPIGGKRAFLDARTRLPLILPGRYRVAGPSFSRKGRRIFFGAEPIVQRSPKGRGKLERRSASQRLIQIADDVVGGFQPDRNAHDFRPRAGGLALIVGELSVGGRGRVQDQAAGITHIG